MLLPTRLSYARYLWRAETRLFWQKTDRANEEKVENDNVKKYTCIYTYRVIRFVSCFSRVRLGFRKHFGVLLLFLRLFSCAVSHSNHPRFIRNNVQINSDKNYTLRVYMKPERHVATLNNLCTINRNDYSGQWSDRHDFVMYIVVLGKVSNVLPQQRRRNK